MQHTLTGRPMIFGEVLFDCFPDGASILGGAPFNVAWHLHAFGQSPLFISRVGNDALGQKIRAIMQQWGMDDSGLQEDPSHPTGSVEVSFQDGEPHYRIADGRAYDFIAAADLPAMPDIALIYHGSLALRGTVTRHAFDALRARCAAPRFIDVNLRPPWWQRQSVLALLDDARWVKLNTDELSRLGVNHDGSAESAEALRQRHRLDTLILTRGAQGAQLLAANASLSIAPERSAQVVDSVGAGDAFSSVILLGLLQNWPMATTLERAQAFASAIVGQRGATVSERQFYTGFAKAWDLTQK